MDLFFSRSVSPRQCLMDESFCCAGNNAEWTYELYKSYQSKVQWYYSRCTDIRDVADNACQIYLLLLGWVHHIH